MSNIVNELETIKKNLRGVRDREIRSRALFLIDCLESQNVTLTSKRYGHNRNTFYRWHKRLKENNYDLDTLRDRSRRPKSNPRRIDSKIIDLATEVRGKEGLGAETVSILLEREHGVIVSASTLGYNFRQRGITQAYKKPNKNKHKKRYAKAEPLEQVQTDTTTLPVVDNNNHKIRAYPVIDDCSRAVTVHVADEHSGHEATKGMRKFIEKFGVPKNAQTDWGSEFTYEHLSDDKRSEFDQLLDEIGSNHVLIKPGTPQLNGKVERFNKTLKRHLCYKLHDGMTIAEIQKVVDEYLDWYNRKRPHKSLKYLTPHEKFYSPRIAKIAS